jgi:hypothetical protein
MASASADTPFLRPHNQGAAKEWTELDYLLEMDQPFIVEAFSYRSHPVPGRKPGVFHQFFPAMARTTTEVATRLLHEYVRVFNTLRRADVGDVPLTDQEFLLLEFGAAFIRRHSGVIDAARKEFGQRKREAHGAIMRMSPEEVMAFGAGTDFRAMVERIIKEGDVPEEAAGISMVDVLGGCFKRLPDGSWLPWVKYRKPRTPKGTWLQEQGRHRYHDLGLAIATTGLHLSMLAPADGRELLHGPGGIRRWATGLDFKGIGKPPLRWRLPLHVVADSTFPAALWAGLKAYGFHFRTIVLESSALASVPEPLRRAMVQLDRFLRATCPGSMTRYWKMPTLRTEQRGALQSFDNQDLTSSSALECPHCLSPLPISTHPRTGSPTEPYVACPCGTTTSIGLMLADRARLEGAWHFVEPDPYDLA